MRTGNLHIPLLERIKPNVHIRVRSEAWVSTHVPVTTKTHPGVPTGLPGVDLSESASIQSLKVQSFPMEPEGGGFNPGINLFKKVFLHLLLIITSHEYSTMFLGTS